MAFKPQEIAQITVGGMIFRDWETVIVVLAEEVSNSSFQFSVSEGKPLAKDAAALRIKPGDHCTVTLAGQLAITGYVETRRVSYTAESHQVELTGHGMTKATADAAVMHKTMEFKNKPIVPIVKELLKPVGIQLKTFGNISNKPFERINIAPGTSIWEAAEMLARQRKVSLGSDVQGNLTMRGEFSSGGASLVEGVNILEGREVWTISQGQGPQHDVRQNTGTNEHWGANAAHQNKAQSSSKPAGAGTGVHAASVNKGETPGDKQDSQTRVDQESKERGQETLRVTIVVQGWLKPGGGGLWLPPEMVHVKAPMLIVDESLKLMTATFTQDNRSGSRTTLELVRDTGEAGKHDVSPQTGTSTSTSTATSPPASAPSAPPALGE